MKRCIKILIAAAIAVYIVFSLTVRDLRGVFSVDTNFRKETRYIIIHHDDICRDNSIKEIEDYHRDSCGWSCGFAYNIYIKDGKVNIMHDLNAQLAHTKGYNSSAIGVCIHTTDKKNIRNQIVLILTIKFLMLKYSIPAENVRGHCDFNDTKCPEMNLKKLREWL
jgi:hypothetical protein